MSRQKDVRLIIREMAEQPEYKHLSYKDILEVVYWSQFGFINDLMASGDKMDADSFHSVRLGHIGSFIAHPKRVKSRIDYLTTKGSIFDKKDTP